MRRNRKKIAGILVLVFLMLGMLGGCQKQTAPADTAQKQQDSDAWMETEEETEEYFNMSDAKEDTRDYSKYEEKKVTNQDAYQTDPVPEGQQQPVEPENAVIDEKTTWTCYLSVSCSTVLDNMEDLKEGKETVVPSNGIIYSRSAVTFNPGESVYDILYRTMKENRIHLDAAFTPGYNSYYIRGINNLYEQDCGDPSGWSYCVNGWYPNYGCSRYAVQDGDEIQWNYTCDGGSDLGRNWYDERKTARCICILPSDCFIYIFCICNRVRHVYDAPGISYYFLSGRMGILFLSQREKSSSDQFVVDVSGILFISSVESAFESSGVTILFYMWTGNPFTLESVIYGLASGVMLVSVLNWFSCYQSVMTSDKFIYLFGKIIPAISLILSMVLRFVPKYKHQIQKVSQAQQCIGRDVSDGSLLARAKHGMKILSIMTTWALENSVETADSMRSRGYGLRGRTNYTIYRFDTRDRGMLAGIVLCGSVVIAAVLLREIEVLYFPVFQLSSGTGKSMAAYLGYGILCFLPLAVNLAEDVKWRYLRSTI